jgi:hypothetical protein
MDPTAMLLLATVEVYFLCFSLVGEPKKWDVPVNHEKDIKHKLSDNGLILCCHCCLNFVLRDATACKLVQHTEDSEAGTVLKFAIENFYAEGEDSRFF